MRLKKNKRNKTVNMGFRVTEAEANKIIQKANIYTEGNVSEYLLFAALNFIPGKEDFEDKKGRK